MIQTFTCDLSASSCSTQRFGVLKRLRVRTRHRLRPLRQRVPAQDEQRSIGIYHNMTPPELVELAGPGKRSSAGFSCVRTSRCLDHVACDSEFNRQDLLDCGLPERQLSVLPLPPRVSLPRLRPCAGASIPIEILFVGRLVRAKGVHDLLEAAAQLQSAGERGFRLTLAGSPQFSEPEVMQAIRSRRYGIGRMSAVIPDADDDTLDRLYRNSSVFAMPSYHEGYCLPVLEAFHAGCQVVAYDAGNLPRSSVASVRSSRRAMSPA